MYLDSPHRGGQVGEPPRVRGKPLKFSDDNAFHHEVRRRVDAELKRTDRSQRDSARMYLKTAIILSAFALAYVALVFFVNHGPQALLLSMALGVATAGIGFDIMGLVEVLWTDVCLTQV